MNNYNIYSRRTRGLDNRVWYVMIGTIILIACFLAFRLMYPVKCTPFFFSIKPGASATDTLFYKDEKITFTASVDNDDITWDFGDNTTRQRGWLVTHSFPVKGKYDIRASINSNCEVLKNITIGDAPVENVTRSNIEGPDTVKIQKTEKEASFSCPDIAYSYEWTVKDHPELSGTGAKVKFKFTLPGDYIIQVRLNGDLNDSKMGLKPVYVKLDLKQQDKKPCPPNCDPPPCATPISNVQLAMLLTKVINRELESKNFSQYLCYGDDTKVMVNGKQMKFGVVCQKLSDIDNKDKPTVSFQLLQISRSDVTIKGGLVRGAVTEISFDLKVRRKHRLGGGTVSKTLDLE